MGTVTAERYDIFRPAPASLDEIRDPDDRSFPVGVLRGKRTALVLFAAAWYGTQDAVYVADAGLAATCVDIRGENLPAMRLLYPDGWEFVQADVYEYVASNPGVWDVVTVDCPSGHFQQCADMLPVFCDAAAQAVVLGTGVDTKVTVPDGWRILGRNRRSLMYGGVYWTVLVRA